VINEVVNVDQLPLILQLNAGGEPVNWINYEKSAYFYSKDRVLWDMGRHDVTLRGGTNAATGERSVLSMATIIAVKCNHSPRKFRSGVPSLTNRTLFIRDHSICGYCGNSFKKTELTRDHVVPKSKGGANSWTNLVTACKDCNHKKAARTPKEAGMPLIYVPYVPNYNEHLILQNRRILFDQMEYLKKGISKNSRIHQLIESNYYSF
jgi:5-methylcytosine-specific restriction endonuclease McrA